MWFFYVPPVFYVCSCLPIASSRLFGTKGAERAKTTYNKKYNKEMKLEGPKLHYFYHGFIETFINLIVSITSRLFR